MEEPGRSGISASGELCSVVNSAMKPRKAAVLASGWTLPILLLQQVSCSGVFELHLQSFRNDLGLNKDGNCCNGYRSEGACTSTCRTFFRVCLTHYQAAIATDPNPRCTFADYTTPVVAKNSANFTVATAPPLTDNLAVLDNPMRFPIKEFKWPGDFSLIIEVWHDTTLTGPSAGSPRELISRLAVQRSAAAGTDWYNSKNTTRYHELRYSYRFVCDENYYGPSCEELCRPRDDQFGHSYCSENGTKVCLDGWEGEYCDKAICMPGCHPDNGFCDEPNECKCKLGWEGKHCNVCIPYPGCHPDHGTCKKPYWECNCEEGWGGLFCNQDLNFCTHHAPCKNGGTCTNTGQGSYTCNCRPGFTGTNCEVDIDYCEAQPCLYGGTCQETGISYQCSCPQGFFGDHCELQANYCRVETCFNGGTCVDHGGSYQCQCAQGYQGFHCEVDTGGCKQDTCLNGGHCVNGKCICPTGFSGPTCDDSVDDCAHAPCLNGGTCMDLTNDFKCRCKPGFVGPLCQINVDDCEMRPCANGGSCTDLVDDFRCECMLGFTGKDCSVNVNECDRRPCQNGGTCFDRVADYSCECPDSFWGKDCHLYEGMSTTPGAPTSKTKLPTVQQTTPPAPPTTEDPIHRSGNISQQVGGEGAGLTSQQLLVVVCVGGGLPLVLIIVVVVILLCRKRRHLQQTQHNMDKERHQNYINNMNNRGDHKLDRDSKCVDDGGGTSGGSGSGGGGSGPSMLGGGAKVGDSKLEGGRPIFTTPFPHTSALPSAASSVKISNEEQQDINRLNAQQHRDARDKAAGKNFIRDSLVHEPPVYPPSPSHRDSFVNEKPRRLEVDTLSRDTKVDLSPYHRPHSGDISIIVKPPLAPAAERDNVRASMYLEPTHSRHTCYTDDYLATEV